MALLKERLKNGEQVLGTMVTTFASPDIAKILQSCGFDFFIVDCEHGAFTTREAANIIAVARGIGMPALVRIPEMRREHALKFMEMGRPGCFCPIRKQPNRRVCWWTAPNTRLWDTGAFRFRVRIRILKE